MRGLSPGEVQGSEKGEVSKTPSEASSKRSEMVTQVTHILFPSQLQVHGKLLKMPSWNLRERDRELQHFGLPEVPRGNVRIGTWLGFVPVHNQIELFGGHVQEC